MIENRGEREGKRRDTKKLNNYRISKREGENMIREERETDKRPRSCGKITR